MKIKDDVTKFKAIQILSSATNDCDKMALRFLKAMLPIHKNNDTEIMKFINESIKFVTENRGDKEDILEKEEVNKEKINITIEEKEESSKEEENEKKKKKKKKKKKGKKKHKKKKKEKNKNDD